MNSNFRVFVLVIAAILAFSVPMASFARTDENMKVAEDPSFDGTPLDGGGAGRLATCRDACYSANTQCLYTAITYNDGWDFVELRDVCHAVLYMCLIGCDNADYD